MGYHDIEFTTPNMMIGWQLRCKLGLSHKTDIVVVKQNKEVQNYNDGGIKELK